MKKVKELYDVALLYRIAATGVLKGHMPSADKKKPAVVVGAGFVVQMVNAYVAARAVYVASRRAPEMYPDTQEMFALREAVG